MLVWQQLCWHEEEVRRSKLNHIIQPDLRKIRQILSPQNLLCFVILFALLAFRTPEDLFTPYLYSEDGGVLIQGSIYNGIRGIVKPGNGTYWVIQKALALLCYWVILPTRSIAALPYIMQVLTKILGTLSVMYFISDRFQWLVSKRTYRFWICVGIILLMPQHADDVLVCDTSLPFQLFFVAFLIGLDLLCSGKYDTPNWGQTVFFMLLAVSTASALCLAAIVAASFLQWIVVQVEHGTLKKRAVGIEIFKLCMICGAVWIQVRLVLSSDRVSGSLDLTNRMILSLKSFVFFSYWNKFQTWRAFFVGLIIWAFIGCIIKLPWKTVLYCGGFSYLFMLYCSMVTSAEEFYQTMYGRYVFTCYEIAALMIGLAVVKFLGSGQPSKKNIGYVVLCATAIISLRTYNVPVTASECGEIYTTYCGLYEANGQDQMRLPIAPFKPLAFVVPVEISSKQMIDDLEFGVEYLDGIWVFNEAFGQLKPNTIWNEHELSGYIRSSTKNQTFRRLFIKSGASYTAAREITERAFFHEEPWMHNGYSFCAPLFHFSEGTTRLEIVGEADDGTWHCGTLDITTTFEWEGIS